MQISDGEATVDATGPHEHLSELDSQLWTFGLEFNVEHIQERPHTAQLLAETQRGIVLVAVERGYYDTLRTYRLTEQADVVGLAKSAGSERLHRAEETMIKHVIEGFPTPTDPERRIVGPNTDAAAE